MTMATVWCVESAGCRFFLFAKVLSGLSTSLFTLEDIFWFEGFIVGTAMELTQILYYFHKILGLPFKLAILLRKDTEMLLLL